jgi:hypothetical protein
VASVDITRQVASVAQDAITAGSEALQKSLGEVLAEVGSLRG